MMSQNHPFGIKCRYLPFLQQKSMPDQAIKSPALKVPVNQAQNLFQADSKTLGQGRDSQAGRRNKKVYKTISSSGRGDFAIDRSRPFQMDRRGAKRQGESAGTDCICQPDEMMRINNFSLCNTATLSRIIVVMCITLTSACQKCFNFITFGNFCSILFNVETFEIRNDQDPILQICLLFSYNLYTFSYRL